MKLPLGFGKNYFSLNAITATVNQVTLDANAARTKTFHNLLSSVSFEGKEDEFQDELELEEICPLQLSNKASDCNCHFNRYTKKTLKQHPRPNLHLNYHKTLNNSISPP